MVLRAASLRCLSRQGRLSSLKRKLASMTDLATIARQNAVECIKVGYRQGKEGHILSLAMNPHDVPDAVATASLGSRWMVALVQISDDEQPQGQDNSGSAPSPSLADAADSPAAASEVGSAPGLASGWSPPQAPARGAAEPATKPKKHWDELKPSQQAGMACRDASFREWTQDVMASPEHRWDGAEYCDSFMSEEGTKDWPACYVRWYCGVTSRSDLDTNPEAAKRWRELHSMFTADTQYGDRR